MLLSFKVCISEISGVNQARKRLCLTLLDFTGVELSNCSNMILCHLEKSMSIFVELAEKELSDI